MQKFVDSIPSPIRWFLTVIFPIIYVWMVLSFKMEIWGIASGRNPFLVILESAVLPALMGATTYLLAPTHKRTVAKVPTVLWALYVTSVELLLLYYTTQYIGIFHPEVYQNLLSQNAIVSYIAVAANIFSAIMTCYFINKIHKKAMTDIEK